MRRRNRVLALLTHLLVGRRERLSVSELLHVANPLIVHRKPHTDIANADRLVFRHGNQIRYCQVWKSWLCHDGKRWKKDEVGRICELARDTVLEMYREAAQIEYREVRKALIKHAMASESEKRIRAMIKLAQSNPLVAIHPSKLDLDPWLLNVQNGTLELRTGRLLEHDPNRLITKLAPVEYYPDAVHPVWDAALERLDPQLQEFLQLAFGSTLTGDTSNELLFFIHGPTKSGKSTDLGAFKEVLGDYAVTTNFSAFLKQTKNDGGSGHRTDLANLAGARMVLSLEVEKGRQLAVALLKHLTGGDKIRARRVYEDEFEYMPQFKLWLVANDRPKASSDDDAFWERMKLVPFGKSLAPGERDKTVKETLYRDPEARSAILAWGVRGTLEWLRRGRELTIPDIVQGATTAYREECDDLAGFFEEKCVLGPEHNVKSSDLFAACESWCKANGVRVPSWNILGDALARRDCSKGKVDRARGWHGIELSGDIMG
jgi:putative DNA primase/helicase